MFWYYLAGLRKYNIKFIHQNIYIINIYLRRFLSQTINRRKMLNKKPLTLKKLCFFIPILNLILLQSWWEKNWLENEYKKKKIIENPIMICKSILNYSLNFFFFLFYFCYFEYIATIHDFAYDFLFRWKLDLKINYI